MRTGPTDAECTVGCVLAHDAKYVPYEGKDVYALSDHRRRKSSWHGRCGSRARWTPSGTIRVDSITATK